jgi:hypothetical protein
MEGARTTTNIFPEAGRGISVLLGLLNSITLKRWKKIVDKNNCFEMVYIGGFLIIYNRRYFL